MQPDHFQISRSRINMAVISRGGRSRKREPSSGSPEVLIHLPDGGSLYFKGKLQVVQVFWGHLECLGHKMAANEGCGGSAVRIYSPRGYSLLRLHGMSATPPSTEVKVIEELLNLTLVMDEATEEATTTKICTSGCLFTVAPLLSDDWTRILTDHLVFYGRHEQVEKMSLFGRDSSTFATSSEGLQDSCGLLEEAEKLLDVSFLPQLEAEENDLDAMMSKSTARLYRPHPGWEAVVQSVRCTSLRKEHPRVLVLGGKGVGKSSFNRYLANRLIAEFGSIIYIDLDPGQSEFTVPGCLSCTKVDRPILGPNFCHMDRKQLHCCLLGDIDTGKNPKKYMECVSALLKKVTQDSTNCAIPWLINTMGFTQGLGLRFTDHILLNCRPNTVVELRSRFAKKNFKEDYDLELRSLRHEAPPSLLPRFNLLRFEAMPESSQAKDMGANDLWGIPESRKLRDIATLSYFGLCQTIATTNLSNEDLPFLKRVTPYQVHFGDIFVQILPPHLRDIPSDNIPNLLLLSLVSLGTAIRVPHNKSEEATRIRTLHSSVPTESRGFGLVRAIDLTQGLFYVLTPLTPDELESVNCLTLGSVFFPDGALISCGLKDKRDAWAGGSKKKIDGSNNKRKQGSLAPIHARPSAPYIDPASRNPLGKPWQRYSKPRVNMVGKDQASVPQKVPEPNVV